MTETPENPPAAPMTTMTDRTLTPALRRLLGLIAERRERGRTKREIHVGRRARSQLRTLMDAGYVEWVFERSAHGWASDHVRSSETGKRALVTLDDHRRITNSGSASPARSREQS